MPDYQLLQEKNQPLDKNEKPCQYCTELLEYGKDNYQDKNKMTDQTVNLATQIFPYAFSNYQALIVFDNIANHACYIENALLAKKMNLGIGGKQSRIRDKFNDIIQQM